MDWPAMFEINWKLSESKPATVGLNMIRSESLLPGPRVMGFGLTTINGTFVSMESIDKESHPTLLITMQVSLHEPTATCPKSIIPEERLKVGIGNSPCARTEDESKMHEANMRNFQALIMPNEPITRKNNSSG
jgi:hypothetical protein